MNTLWEADVVVFKAHITTGPGGKVLDMFWIYDNRCELPENHRFVAGPQYYVHCCNGSIPHMEDMMQSIKCTTSAFWPLNRKQCNQLHDLV